MGGVRTVSNPLALAVLAYLSREPMHPYELSRRLREHGKERSIKFNRGSLYMVVGQLVRAGFVAEQETTREGRRPERTVYALTADGRREWRDWLRELVEEPRHEHPHFVVALSLIAALPPQEVAELLAARLRRVEEQRNEIGALLERSTALGVHALFLVDEEYRLDLLTAEASFLERFIERINHPESGWARPWAAALDESTTHEGRQS